MKLKKLSIITAVLLLSAVSFQSCIGSFTLTNKVLTWNRNVNNKFVNEAVFFVFWVLPVYEVTALADLLVINSIEFWSGTNPLEANNKVVATEHGNYRILADENGYKIDSPDGNILHFIFDQKNQTWSFSLNDNEPSEFLKFKDANHIEIINQSGDFVDVELTREGVDNFINSLGVPMMAMN